MYLGFSEVAGSIVLGKDIEIEGSVTAHGDPNWCWGPIVQYCALGLKAFGSSFWFTSEINWLKCRMILFQFTGFEILRAKLSFRSCWLRGYRDKKWEIMKSAGLGQTKSTCLGCHSLGSDLGVMLEMWLCRRETVVQSPFCWLQAAQSEWCCIHPECKLLLEKKYSASQRMLKASVKMSKGLTVSNSVWEGFVRGEGWGADTKGGRYLGSGL